MHNRAATIGEALSSLAAQDYGPVEHVIQDGGSTDGTLEIIERHAGPGTKLQSGPDNGIYDALNKGLARSTGDVIGILHSDDIFAEAHVLSKVAKAFDTNEVDGVYGDLDYVTKGGRVIRHWTAGSYDPSKLRRGWMPPHPALFLRREVLDRYGAYDTAYRIAADYEAILRWLRQGDVRLAYIPEVLVMMRLGGESNRSFGHILRKSAEDYRALRQNRVGGAGTLALKNLRKLGQFITR